MAHRNRLAVENLARPSEPPPSSPRPIREPRLRRDELTYSFSMSSCQNSPFGPAPHLVPIRERRPKAASHPFRPMPFIQHPASAPVDAAPCNSVPYPSLPDLCRPPRAPSSSPSATPASSATPPSSRGSRCGCGIRDGGGLGPHHAC